MLKLGLLSDFKRQVLQWDGVTVPTKEPIGLLGQTDLTNQKMHKVAIQNTEPVSTREATKRLFKIFKII